MTMLGHAIAIAADVHKDMTDKAGVTYMLHPLKAMHDVRWMGEEAMCVAVLHDVWEDMHKAGKSREDYDWSVFTPTVLHCLGLVTNDNKKGQTYGQFVMQCALHPIALEVKLADIKSNSDLRRMPLDRDIDEKDIARWRKYRIAAIYLNRIKRGEQPESIEDLD